MPDVIPTALQIELDQRLSRSYTVDVEISDLIPIPYDRHGYVPLRNLPERGFSFTAFELLHAIGAKCAPIPVTRNDESIRYALIHKDMLDLTSPDLTIDTTYVPSDLLSNRSEEFGIGMMCLFAEKIIGVPWDVLEPIPPPGTRFDYQGSNGTLNCIFESRGASASSTQNHQVKEAVGKKGPIRQGNEHPFDVELVVSTLIGRSGIRPKIVIADPDRSKLNEIYKKTNKRYYRLRHYCRILQYIGLPESAYYLNQFSKYYLSGKKSILKTIDAEKETNGRLTPITIQGDAFLGRWFDTWTPEESKKHKKLRNAEKKYRQELPQKIYVFQGIRRDIYLAGLDKDEPFNHTLLDNAAISKYKKFNDAGVSVFPDGSVMIFKYGDA